jgi:hypothetical protein
VALGIPPGRSFYEEATFWNAQWGTPIGANETTDINDMSTTAVEVGAGALLSRSSYHAMTDPDLLGFGRAQPGCAPSCFKQTNIYNFGLGVRRRGTTRTPVSRYSGPSLRTLHPMTRHRHRA